MIECAEILTFCSTVRRMFRHINSFRGKWPYSIALVNCPKHSFQCPENRRGIKVGNIEILFHDICNASREIGHTDICRRCNSRSACASRLYDLELRCPLYCLKESHRLISGQCGSQIRLIPYCRRAPFRVSRHIYMINKYLRLDW